MRPLFGSIAMDQARQDSVHEIGNRSIARLGEGEALALLFDSPYLERTWQNYISAGYQCSYPTFTPHITLSWDEGRLNKEEYIKPYLGEIILGGEIHEPVKEKWNDDDGVVNKTPIPGSLYVRRNVINAMEIMDWAREQNIVGRINHADKLHATIVYSKQPIPGLYYVDTRTIVNRGKLK